jgi:hypothetical protein
MRRVSLVLIIAAFAMTNFLGGCRDERDPEYNIDLMYDRPWREHALKNLNEIFSNAMQANDSDLTKPELKQLIEVMVPGLIKGYKEFNRDKFNRLEIIKLLAQLNDPRSVEVFLDALAMEDTSDSTGFIVASTAVRRQKVEEALPKLLEAYKKCVAARDRRPGAPFTNSENEITQAVIGSVVPIVNAHPNSSHKSAVVQALIDISDTPDTLQELRLNMRAMKGLGVIADPAAIPVLVRGIAMKGKRQPVGLGQIAFAALQQIHDRDAVVEAVIKFGKLEDEDFKKYYAEEMKSDPMMANPHWYTQQAVTFLGDLGYPSPRVISYLESELNHETPDAVDEAAAKTEGLSVNFAADGWATMRRNWAAVALAQLGHKPLMDTIARRIVFKTEGKAKVLQIQAEEAVGYVRAMGLLQFAKESCPLLLEMGRAGDDSMRDKTYYNASLMCGEEFLPDMQKSLEKIDCEAIVGERFPDGASEEEETQTKNECEVLKKRIQGYMERINYGKTCGQDLDCYLKEIASHQSKEIERAIWTAYRFARDDASKRDIVLKTLIDNLHNPNKVALDTAVIVLDRITPEGSQELVDKIQVVFKDFSRQATYKDRARSLEAFIGHVRNRMK